MHGNPSHAQYDTQLKKNIYDAIITNNKLKTNKTNNETKDGI